MELYSKLFYILSYANQDAALIASSHKESQASEIKLDCLATLITVKMDGTQSHGDTLCSACVQHSDALNQVGYHFSHRGIGCNSHLDVPRGPALGVTEFSVFV